MVKAGILVVGLLVALPPLMSVGSVVGEEPERPRPWGDRWEPPRPPEIPEPGAPVGAAEFAADCNDDGVVRIAADLEVRGGSGTLTSDCHVEVGDGVSLALLDVTLAGPYAFDLRCGVASRLSLANSYLTLATRIGYGGLGGARLSIRDSELSTMAGGAIEISFAGDESGIEVLDSMMMSDGAILIEVSPRADRGRLEVRRATLAVGAGSGSDLSLTASLDGLAGEAVVVESELIGASLIAIETGAQGRTEVRDNIIETPGQIRIAAGDGGDCEATGNDPEMACPPPAESGKTAVASAVSESSEDQ